MEVRGIDSSVLAGGEVIQQAGGEEAGYWAGAPSVFHDGVEGVFYLSYRLRRPRTVEPDRGAEVRIARSSDGVRFDDVRVFKKGEFGTVSLERCPLRRGADGQWRFYVSYVDPADGRWCISMLTAPAVEQLEAGQMRRVLSAADVGLEGIKDPWVFECAGAFWMLVSVAAATGATSERSHGTSDIYNTGECLSATGLARSQDLDEWEWLGVVARPSDAGWDRYCRRISCAVPYGGKFFGFYDGSASHHENYEEKTGLVVSQDLRNWHCLTEDGPMLMSPYGSGSLRYMDAQIIGGEVYMYYELALADGSHDLRVVRQDVRVLELQLQQKQRVR